MKSLKLENGDLKLESGNFQLVEGKDEVKQRLKVELSTNVGEWFLNLQLGVPWMEMLSEDEPPERFRAEISKVLTADSDVEEIKNVEINMDRPNRKLTINIEIIIDGELINESVVI